MAGPGSLRAFPISIFRSANGYLADNDRLLGSISFRVFGVVAHRKPKDSPRDLQSLGHLPEDGEMFVQERRLAQRDVEAAGRGVRLHAVGSADGAQVMRLLADFG